MTLFKEYLSAKFVAFIIAGGIAALANIAARYVLSVWAGLAYAPAIVCAYLVGMIVAFALNRLLVFTPGRHDSPLRQAAVFTLVNALAVCQTLLISLLLAHALQGHCKPDIADTLAHVAGVAVPVFTSYIGHKRYSFKDLS